MTSEQLIKIMSNNGMTNNDVALIAGVTERQVTSWRNETHSIPRAVGLVLSAYDTGLIDLTWMEKYIQKDLLSQVA